MKTNVAINYGLAGRIVETTLNTATHTLLNRFGFIGIIDADKTNTQEPEVFCLGVPNLISSMEIRMVLKDLKCEKRGRTEDQTVVNTYPGMAGIKTGTTICIGYSPLPHQTNEAMAVVYALYHELKKIEQIEDDRFSDMLLLRTGEWQQRNKWANELVVQLAQRIFKPELIM